MSTDIQYPPGHPSQGAPGGVPLPQRGVFATSEVVPLLQQAAGRMRELGAEWKRLRIEANEKAAYAKKTRADLIVTLRVWGNDGTAGVPIKTSAERNEWADADADVQQAELDADLAQTLQMVAREAYNDAQGYFSALQGLVAVERDDLKREHGGHGGGGPF